MFYRWDKVLMLEGRAWVLKISKQVEIAECPPLFEVCNFYKLLSSGRDYTNALWFLGIV